MEIGGVEINIEEPKKTFKLCIFVHSGEFDRLHSAFSIALVTLAMRGEVHMLFSYHALQKLVKGKTDSIEVEDTALKEAMGKNIDRGTIPPISEMIKMGKRFGRLKIYACVNSMALSNITRDELIDEVDSSMGLATFMELVKDATTTLYI